MTKQLRSDNRINEPDLDMRKNGKADQRVKRVFRFWISLIVCTTILYPSGVFAQACSGLDITTTPAPSPSPRSRELYLTQLHSVVSTDVDLILLGDSLAESWDTRMFQPMSVVNLGVAGDKIQNVLWRLASPEWSKLKPSSIFIMLGTNNLRAKPCAVIDGLTKVVERVKSIWPSTKAVFLEITPRGQGFFEYNSDRVEINAAMRNVPGIKTINVDDEITCGWQSAGECASYKTDNLHFSAAGYEIILKRLKQALFVE
jgi:platelet-activating factor acetylhydrolase IB subunit beta/gamma